MQEFVNPEYRFFKERQVNIREIDFQGKTIGLAALDYCRSPEDARNFYYGDKGTVSDIAEKIIGYYGGKTQGATTYDIDYVVESERMPIPKKYESDEDALNDFYFNYCNHVEQRKRWITEADKKRKKQKKPTIKVVFEEEFHSWLKNQFEELSKIEGMFLPYGVITIMVKTMDSYTVQSFKSEFFADIPQDIMEKALGGCESVCDFFSTLEVLTKEGAFANVNAKRAMLDFEGKNINSYTEIVVNYRTSIGIEYKVSKKMEPSLVVIYTNLTKLRNTGSFSTLEEVKAILNQGKKVEIKYTCSSIDRTEKKACSRLMQELPKKVASMGVVEYGPKEQMNEISMIIAPLTEISK